ncbi:spermidine synthase [Mycena rosella]|uniref:Spermidine synthase n=1 Tax=Mycena rosella TaxID=1033263 RepID=A0AAD7G3T5_MYCRO|nr:spermidine synthase [Mycena rosella]
MPISWPSGPAGLVCRLGADITVLVALSLVLFVYERALIPLYGSGPTTYTLNSAVICATLVAAAHPLEVRWTRTLLFAGVLFSAAPLATYWVAVWTSRRDSPILGPILTHFSVLVPLLSVLASFAAEINLFDSATSSGKVSRNPIGYRLLAGLACFVGTVGLSPLWAKVSYLDNVSDTQIFLGLAVAMFNVWIASMQLPRRSAAAKQKKKKAPPPSSPSFIKPLLMVVFNVVWWTTHGWLASPVLHHPLSQLYMHPSFPLLIHSSVQSITGLIVVGEALPPPSYRGGPDSEMHSLRYLRASHSLLGGVWVGAKVATLDDAPPLVDSYGTALGDSIYSAFVLQEAARLVNSSSEGAHRTWDRALIIGLGVGISATAFNRHGIATTIVEIDPAVYDAARLYFGLPEHAPDNLFLEDARTWAARRRTDLESGAQHALFDIIVHDCFSGGGVPEHIFTLEFWNDLKASLHPEGILAVNFAGMIISDASRMISQTLAQSFGTCRVFHDSQQLLEETYETELINLVFFCSPHTNPLTFRKARRSDYLDSYLREHVLATLPSREVAFELLTGELEEKFILTDAHNPLGKLQDAQGHHHWSLMRQVLPDVFWETY